VTFPHIEPNQKNDLPDYLQEAHVKRVFEVNNAVMEAFLNCEAKGADCLECGNQECFEAFKAQAELWGMTLHELMQSWKRQRELDEKRAAAQKLRYENYQRAFEQKSIMQRLKKSDSNERSLFDAAA
jgi:hypothetical protein